VKIKWKNAEAGRRFAELVKRGDGVTAAEIGELLAMEGHNVTVEGRVMTVHPTQPTALAATLPWGRADKIGRPFTEPMVMVLGNARARRRWRRRNVPNTQRPTSNMAAQSMAAWNAADDAMAEGIATWHADVARGDS